MRPEWHGLLRAPLSGEPLRFDGGCGENGLDSESGSLITPRGHRVATVSEGIPDFVQMPTWATFDQTKDNTEGWVQQGWRRQQALAREPVFRDMVADILAAGPLILELGAGPGGGHMPMILERQPHASILINDFEIKMLRDWRDFFRSSGHGLHASLACFDACAMPLVSDSIDCVSSHGCFSNIKAHRDLAVKESFRVLRPGGILVMVDGQIVQPSPEELYKMLAASDMPDPWMMVPGLVTGWTALVESAGFTVVRDHSIVRRPLAPGDGDLGRLAQKQGVTLEMEMRVIVAVK